MSGSFQLSKRAQNRLLQVISAWDNVRLHYADIRREVVRKGGPLLPARIQDVDSVLSGRDLMLKHVADRLEATEPKPRVK